MFLRKLLENFARVTVGSPVIPVHPSI